MRVFYKRNSVNTFLFLANNHVLFVEGTASSNNDKFRIRFDKEDKYQFEEYSQLSGEFKGILGLVEINGNSFVVLLEDYEKVATPRPSEHIYSIRKVRIVCLNNLEFNQLDILEESHPCHNLHRLLSTGRFYYSHDFDLTNTLQRRGSDFKNYQQIYDNYNPAYFWNSAMINEFLNFRRRMLGDEKQVFDESGFLSVIIRGFVKTIDLKIYSGLESSITLISKLSNDWRISNDTEDVNSIVNNIESEFIFYNNVSLISYVQLLGNLPLFKTNDNKKYINEDLFEKQLDELVSKYDSLIILDHSVHIDHGEIDRLLDEKEIGYFDITKDLSTSGSKSLLEEELKEPILDISVFSVQSNGFTCHQSGIFKICFSNFDHSLEYSNNIFELINQTVLEKALLDLQNYKLSDSFIEQHKLLWEENYFKLNEFFQVELYSDDYLNETSTLVLNPGNFKLIDLIHINKITVPLINPVTTRDALGGGGGVQKSISLFTGSFNVNGEVVPKDEDLSYWLFPNDGTNTYDIVAIGLQEVIELSTNKLIIVDDSNKKRWEYSIYQCLNSRYHSYEKLVSLQLGGIVLLIFVKQDQIKNISNIEKILKKTGFGGISANKGAAAVSFSYWNTRICIISSHLSAGQDNIEKRHKDFKMIINKIHFRGVNRSIKKYHDAIVWMGDFNYRITNMKNKAVKEAIFTGDYNLLLENDQLIKQMMDGESFPFFHEMEIKFPPTYKFNKGTSVYDTGEKKRIPAWTDRILFRGKVKQLEYDYVPSLQFSDHRPIYGIFDIKAENIDDPYDSLKENNLRYTSHDDILFHEEERSKSRNSISLNHDDLESRRNSFISINDDNGDRTDQSDYPYINGTESSSRQRSFPELNNNSSYNRNQDGYHHLPPPSSDSSSKYWWIDPNNGKIKVEGLNVSKAFNPSLRPNPFKGDEFI